MQARLTQQKVPQYSFELDLTPWAIFLTILLTDQAYKHLLTTGVSCGDFLSCKFTWEEFPLLTDAKDPHGASFFGKFRMHRELFAFQCTIFVKENLQTGMLEQKKILQCIWRSSSYDLTTWGKQNNIQGKHLKSSTYINDCVREIKMRNICKSPLSAV